MALNFSFSWTSSSENGEQRDTLSFAGLRFEFSGEKEQRSKKKMIRTQEKEEEEKEQEEDMPIEGPPANGNPVWAQERSCIINSRPKFYPPELHIIACLFPQSIIESTLRPSQALFFKDKVGASSFYVRINIALVRKWTRLEHETHVQLYKHSWMVCFG